jgi:hypothetical protein
LNGKNVYEVNSTLAGTGRCPLYFADTGYKIIILQLKRPGTYVALVRNRVPQIEETLRSYASANAPMDDEKMDEVVYILNTPLGSSRVALFVSTDKCTHLLSLGSAQQLIGELNQQLQTRCPSLRLVLNYVYNLHGAVTAFSYGRFKNHDEFYMNALILCLTDDQSGCVSSLELANDSRATLSINSSTDEGFKRLSFNKLLRAALILVAPLIADTAFIESRAVNPVSAWSLLGYYRNVIVDDTDIQELIDRHQTQKEILVPLLQDKSLNITVPLNDFNERVAQTVFRTCLQDICKYVDKVPRPTRFYPDELVTNVRDEMRPPPAAAPAHGNSSGRKRPAQTDDRDD